MSPAELLLKRKLRTKLPSLNEMSRDTTDSEARDRDFENKSKGKDYSDRRSDNSNNVKIGDQVLVKQEKQNKLTPTFEERPYVVTSKNGNEVTVARDDGRQLRRNTSFVKKYIQDEEKLGESNGGNSKDTHDNSTTEVPAKPKSPRAEVPLSRPSRTRNVPSRFQDFIMN